MAHLTTSVPFPLLIWCLNIFYNIQSIYLYHRSSFVIDQLLIFVCVSGQQVSFYPTLFIANHTLLMGVASTETESEAVSAFSVQLFSSCMSAIQDLWLPTETMESHSQDALGTLLRL